MRRRRDEPSMEDRFMSQAPAAARNRRLANATATMRHFGRLVLVAAAVAVVLGVVAALATGHGVFAGAVWGLWVAGAVGVVLGGSGGAGVNSSVAARQRSSRGLLPGQLDPLGLILIGFALLAIGVALAVLF